MILCDWVSHLSARHKRKVLSDERLGAKLRVTENWCVVFNSLTYVYLALLPQYWAHYAKVDSTPTFIYIYINIYIYIYIFVDMCLYICVYIYLEVGQMNKMIDYNQELHTFKCGEWYVYLHWSAIVITLVKVSDTQSKCTPASIKKLFAL